MADQSDLARTDPEAALAAMTVDEKAAMTAGADVWTVAGVPRLGLPAIKMTDGPNGARGGQLYGGSVRSTCVPCGSALGATFDPALIADVGALLGREARQKRSRVLLAPTINLPRSPLYGRAFECYSEDPLLAGSAAAAFVAGVQSEGVATTPKHLVGNEAEFERMTINSIIDERTLREVYLLPFEMAIRNGGSLGIMTAYNRLNGRWCSLDPELLNTILRDEWGFEGFVVSDWFAAGDTVGSLDAGLDIQMPGPDRFFGAPLAKAIANGQADEALLDQIVRRRLLVHDRLEAWDDDAELDELSEETEDGRALARRAATESMVLLSNDGVLPLASDVASIALIGPNAVTAHIMGGGSAQLSAHRLVTPEQALGEVVGDDRLVVERGCVIDKIAPSMRPTGGFEIEFFAGDEWAGDVVGTRTQKGGRAIFVGEPVPGLEMDRFSARMTGHITVEDDEAGEHTFTLIQTHGARLSIDGELVIDGITETPPPGEAFFGQGSIEMTASRVLAAGQTVEVVVEFMAPGGTGLRGLALGHARPVPGDLVQRAAAAAANADVAVVVVGTSSEWETEGNDRATLALPGDQDELVAAVCAANPRTVVVVNAGAPVLTPWADDAAAVLVSWLGGQEMAPALCDVLFGAAEPGGRLPISFPQAIEQSAAYGNFPGENNVTRYGEGLLVGWRWFDSRGLVPAWPFGHGGSYTTFEWGDAVVSGSPLESMTVDVAVTNTGDRAGSDVVQVYARPPAHELFHPAARLVGWAKVHVEPGETVTAHIELNARRFAHWKPAGGGQAELRDQMGDAVDIMPELDPTAMAVSGAAGWHIAPGEWQLCINASSVDERERITVTSAATTTPLAGLP